MNLEQELFNRYKKTGKLGFKRPKNDEEANLIIRSIIGACSGKSTNIPVDEIHSEITKTTLSLKELTNQLDFLLNKR